MHVVHLVFVDFIRVPKKMWRRVKACSASQSSHSPFSSADAVNFSLSVDIVQTNGFSLQSSIPPWACSTFFFADLYRGCLRAIVTGGGQQRTTCKRRHRRSGLADRRLWQRECAQRSAALCFVLSTVICQRWFIYRVLKVTLEVVPFYFAAVDLCSLYFGGSMTSQVDAKGKRHIFQMTFHKLCLSGGVLRRG